MTAKRHPRRFAIERLVAVSGTTLALLTFIIHDALREKLRDIRDRLTVSASEQSVSENTEEIETRISELESAMTVRLSETETKLINDKQNPALLGQFKHIRQLFEVQKRIAQDSISILSEDAGMMDKISSEWKMKHTAEFEKLSDKVYSVAGGWIYLPDDTTDRATFKKKEREFEDYQISVMEVQNALRDFTFDERAAAEERVSELDGKYLFLTRFSYLLYASVFALNVWVVFFTKLNPEVLE